jgi:hypothetical protein
VKEVVSAVVAGSGGADAEKRRAPTPPSPHPGSGSTSSVRTSPSTGCPLSRCTFFSSSY